MRGKGEGAVYRVPADRSLPLKYWTAVIELPTSTGARRRKVVRSKDKTKALEKLTDLQAELERSGDLATADQTVAQWLTYWVEKIAAKTLRPKTVANYRSFVTKHLIPRIGNKKLEKLTPADVRRVTDSISKELSATTAATAHRIMSSAFTAAERDGRMRRNPAKLAQAPLIPATNLEVLTLDEVRRLLELFDDNTEKVMWSTFLLTGARRGELLGLQWDRVTDVLDLSWQLQRHSVEMVAPANYEHRRLDGGLYLTRPKSKAGWRVVPLVPPLSNLLLRWREVAPRNSHDLVFAGVDGKPIDPDLISKRWPGVLEAAGITKRVRVHDLRHTAVDLLYEAEVPEMIIQEIVGHSSRAMTRAYKSRGNRPQLTDAMTRVSTLLGIES